MYVATQNTDAIQVIKNQREEFGMIISNAMQNTKHNDVNQANLFR